MSSAVLFWLAFLHACFVATASPVAWRAYAADVAHAPQDMERAEWTDASARGPRESIRIPVRAVTTLVVRAMPPLPLGRTDALPLDATHGMAFAPARPTRQLRSTASHHHASRGGVLPYFPTAPPSRA
jgi:hypothetical protein